MNLKNELLKSRRKLIGSSAIARYLALAHSQKFYNAQDILQSTQVYNPLSIFLIKVRLTILLNWQSLYEKENKFRKFLAL